MKSMKTLSLLRGPERRLVEINMCPKGGFSRGFPTLSTELNIHPMVKTLRMRTRNKLSKEMLITMLYNKEIK